MAGIGNYKRFVANGLVSLFLVTAFTAIIGCPPPPPPLRFRAGYSDYWVDFYDYVYDSSGRTTEAYCTNLVTFYGDIDWDCSQYPMVWSYAEYNWMSCTYVDVGGVMRYYDDLYYFYPGYIQETPCSQGYNYPDPPDDTNIHAATTQQRTTDNQLVLPDDIELGDIEMAIEEFRQRLIDDEELRAQLLERLREYIEENGVPSGLLAEPGASRVTNPEEGDPPDDYGTIR